MKKTTDGIISTTLFLFINIHCTNEYCLVGHILALTVRVIICGIIHDLDFRIERAAFEGELMCNTYFTEYTPQLNLLVKLWLAALFV